MPLVSVLLAVHNDARYLPAAVESVLRQSLADLELIVVDDASSDETPGIVGSLTDARVTVLTNDEQLGLAASLNRGLDQASGRYVARLDSDDVALPGRLESQIRRIGAAPAVAVLGGGILDLDGEGRPGTLHRNPLGPTAVRFLALFGAPFFHPTVLVDRELLDDNGLRYDPAFLESEDYDLWTRLLELADGGNLAEALVLKRVHPGQASLNRSDVQESFQRQVALREIAHLAPELGPKEAEAAWLLGSGRGAGRSEAAGPFRDLLAAFERRHGVDREVRECCGESAPARGYPPRTRTRPLLSGTARRRSAQTATGRAGGEEARDSLARATRRLAAPAACHCRLSGTDALPVAAFRSGLRSPRGRARRDLCRADRRRPHVVGRAAAPDHFPARTQAARARPVASSRLSRHAGSRARPAGIAPGCRRRVGLEHIRVAGRDRLVSSAESSIRAARRESRSRPAPRLAACGERAPWFRACCGKPPVRSLWRTASRESLVAGGADRERVRLFANTIDVAAWEERAAELRARRSELRARLGAADDDVVVLSVARMGPEKGLDTLVRAASQTRDARLLVVVAGDGPERSAVEELAHARRVRLHLTGDLSADAVAETYVAADIFALLSTQETWGVVVNEAAASALPLVLSNRVGAAPTISCATVRTACSSLQGTSRRRPLRSHGSPPSGRFREEAGRGRVELVRDWGYEPSVENFVAAVREATAR